MPTQFIFPQIKTHDKADVETSEQTWLNRQKKRWNIELVIRVLWTEMAKTAKYLELEQLANYCSDPALTHSEQWTDFEMS